MVSSRLRKKFADCLVSLLDFDVLLLAGDLKGFGSLRGALCAGHEGEGYRRSTAAEQRWILDEFVALTWYHRKQAIRALNGHSATPAARRGRRCVYDEAVTEGLIVHRTACAGSASRRCCRPWCRRSSATAT